MVGGNAFQINGFLHISYFLSLLMSGSGRAKMVEIAQPTNVGCQTDADT